MLDSLIEGFRASGHCLPMLISTHMEQYDAAVWPETLPDLCMIISCFYIWVRVCVGGWLGGGYSICMLSVNPIIIASFLGFLILVVPSNPFVSCN